MQFLKNKITLKIPKTSLYTPPRAGVKPIKKHKDKTVYTRKEKHKKKMIKIGTVLNITLNFPCNYGNIYLYGYSDCFHRFIINQNEINYTINREEFEYLFNLPLPRLDAGYRKMYIKDRCYNVQYLDS